MGNTLTAIRVEPEQEGKIVKIKNSLASLQAEVGGLIQVIVLDPDPVALIVNEEGKINKLPPNRPIFIGSTLDILRGNIIILGTDKSGDFCSVPADIANKYAFI